MGTPRTAGAERSIAATYALGGSVAGALWLVPTLTHGGLAPVVVASGTALIVGVPTALAEWRAPAGPDPALRAATTSLADVAGLLLASCAMAWIGQGSGVGLAFALLAWPLGALLARGPRWIGLPALVAAAGLVVVAVVRARAMPPWTLLQPEWSDWTTFVGPAVVGGLWLAGAGTGRWSLGPERPPGAVRGPFAAAGLGIAIATAVAVDRGALFEASLGEVVRSPLTDGLLGLAAISLAASTAHAPRAGERRWVRALVGFGLTLGLAATGEHVRPWVWATVIPAVTTLALAAAAVRAAGPDRVAAGIGAGLAGGALVVGWPGLPGRLLDAVLLGALLVVAFWFVATRSVMARRTT